MPAFIRACCVADVQDEPTNSRPMSLHERYAHMPVITRHAQTITYLYQYPFAALPSIEFLRDRVTEVQRKVHHLWAEVVDGDTRKPRLQLRPAGPWAPEDVVLEGSYETSGGETVGSDLRSTVESRLIEQEIARMRARVADGGPAWQVVRYLPDPTPQSPFEPPSQNPSPSSDSPCFIAVSAYHHLLDGTSGLKLSLALLSDYPLVPFPGLAPRMEDHMSLSPSLPFLAKEAYKEFVAPSLPSSFRPQPCWPAEKVKGKPTEFPEAQMSIVLPPAWIAGIKRAGKANGVATLHPVIETALALALHEVMGRPEPPIEVFTPVDVRDSSNPSHPQIGSVIISVLRKAYIHRDLLPYHNDTESKSRPKRSFWTLAQSTAQHHSSRTNRKNALFAIGMLAHVPDPKNTSALISDEPNRRCRTGWEDFFLTGVERPAPFRTSIAISNLGRIQALPPGCTGMQWSQSASAFEEALVVSVVGHELGLAIVLSWREGCAMSRDEAAEWLARFREIIGAVIQDNLGS